MPDIGPEVARRFKEHGWVSLWGEGDQALWSPAELQNIRDHFDAVCAGSYDTGRPPHGVNAFGGQVVKVSNAWLADSVIRSVVFDRRLSGLVAQCLDSDEIYLWADSLYLKPPLAAGEQSIIGWHQDNEYWAASSTNRMATVCVALYDANSESGGLRFADKSHRWGLIHGSHAFTAGDNAHPHTKPTPPAGEQWVEVCPEVPAGGITIHHSLCFHGSGPNRMPTPRRSITIHMIVGEATVAGPLGPEYGLKMGDPVRGPLFPRLFP